MLPIIFMPMTPKFSKHWIPGAFIRVLLSSHLCLACVQKWMDGVRLKLNPEKTGFTVIGDRQTRESIMQNFPPSILEIQSPLLMKLRTYDSGNTFASQLTKVCRACYYHLKDFRCIHKFLSVETAALLANSMISSRIE